jgi:hypothetical protein
MRTREPLIDHRGYDDVVAQTEELVKAELGAVQLTWSRPGARPDMASALIRIFARMAQHVIDNLNQVPNQYFLTFLDLIGAGRTPPRPARAPLTFALAEGAPATAVVPAGARAAAPPPEGEEDEVVFETERALVVHKAALAAVFVDRPDLDLYAERSPESASGCLAPEEDQSGEHSLFVDGGDLLALPAGTKVRVEVGLGELLPPTWTELPITWSYWDGGAWQPLPEVSPQVVEDVEGEARQIGEFELPAPIAPSLVNSRQGRWLRARLDTPLLAAEVSNVPEITDITLGTEFASDELAGDAAFAGTVPLDLSLDFWPFGERPRIGDAFLLASAEVLGKPGAQVTLRFTRSQAALAPASGDDPTLVWETWTSGGWLEIGRSSLTHGSLQPLPLGSANTPYAPDASPHHFSDGTLAFSQSGDVKFTLPDTIAPLSLRGITGSWLRVRIAKGNQVYGSGVRFVPDTIDVAGPNGTTVHVPISVLVDNGYRPPVLAGVSLSYEHTLSRPVSAIVTLNDFEYVARAADGGAGFIPFTHAVGDGPALYLGFDVPFANESASLLLDMAPPPPLAVGATALLDVAGLGAAVFAWEYSAAEGGFTRLGAEDETLGLRRSGMLRFVGPADLGARRLFGRELHWLRARLVDGDFSAVPRLRCVRTNTVWARQATAITDEVLGSSSGSSGQAFKLAQTPVLPGQRIQVLEPAPPPPAEQAAITLAEGADAIVPAFDEGGDPLGVWVTWSEVSNFHTAGSRDRYYLVNRATGQVLFGDGTHGLIPPPGRSNVRARAYEAGGGSRGNLPAGAITGLKTTAPHVEGVTNTVPSVGGADLGSVAQQKELGPRKLRHGGYAITREDFEDLAREASPDVARARAVTPSFDPVAHTTPTPSLVAGSVLVIVIPFGAEARPVPAPPLLEAVRSHLGPRCSPVVSLRVSGPDWVRITARVEIVPASLEAAGGLVATARAAIAAYLHPLTGGPKGQGWEFGRLPQASDVYAILTAIQGVDHIQNLAVLHEQESSPGEWAELPESTPADALHRVLCFSGSHVIDIVSGSGG